MNVKSQVTGETTSRARPSRFRLFHLIMLLLTVRLSVGLDSLNGQQVRSSPQALSAASADSGFGHQDREHVFQVQQGNVWQDGKQRIRVESIVEELQIQGGGGVLSQVRQSGKNKQVFVTLKKDDRRGTKVAVGVFAPDSWVHASNGTIQVMTETMGLQPTEIKRYWIGVRCREEVVQAKPGKGESNSRLVVDEVVPETAAEKAGVRTGDVLLEFNGTPLQRINQLVDEIQQTDGKAVEIRLRRNGKIIAYTIRPMSRNAENSSVQTLIIPAALPEDAQERIERLQNLIHVSDDSTREVRVLIVGPGVNFGKKQVELQLENYVGAIEENPPEKIAKILDRVANRHVGVYQHGDAISFEWTTDPTGRVQGEFIDLESEEFLDKLLIGVTGRTFAFSQLSPRLVLSTKNSKESDATIEFLKQRLDNRQPDQLPPKMISVDLAIQQRLQKVQQDFEKIKQENLKLREQINKLREQLKQYK